MLDRVILFDSNEKFLADLNPETFDPTEIDGLDGESRLVFAYPLQEEDAAQVKEGCLIAIPDHERVDEWKLYEVVNLRSDDVMVYAECNHDYYNLSTDPITSVTTNADNSDIAIMQAIQGTRYQLGNVQINRPLKRSFLRKNPLKLLRLIEREWGGELYFRITITGANQIKRYVDHLTRIGSWDGGRFEFGHNLESFSHEVDFTQILTAMYGWGKGETIAEGEADPLTFADLEWKVANGNPVDKPKGQTWVGDPNALALYGKADGSGGKRHRFGEYESQAETLDGLLWETWAQLQKVNKPLVNIEAKVVDLGAFNPMFSHERARLGDDHLVIASVQSKPIEVKTRIIRFVRYRKNPLKNEVELGNFLPTASAGQSNFEERLSSIERKTGVYDDAATRPEIDPNSPIDASRVQGIIDGVKAQYHNSTGFVYQVPEGLLTLDKAIDNNPTKAMLISGGRFFLANSRDINGEWEWRTYGDGDGFVADEIIAGKLNTDLIEIFGDAYFRWNKQNLYVTDPNDAKKQIRIGKYDGTKYGIAFTKDGGVTWDVALNHEGLRVGSTTVFESGYDPKKVAEEAKAYSDSQKQQIDGQIGNVSQEVKDLNTYVDDVFKYDVIEAGEAEALKTQLKQLANLKGNIDNQYTTLNGNVDLVAGTPKTNLQTAKTNVDTAYTNLINSINTAVLDNQTTSTEKADVLAKYDAFNTNTKVFVQRCEEAVNDIARKKAADAQKNATDAAKSYSDGLKQTIDTSIQGVRDSVTTLNTYVDGAFEDSVIAQSEAIAIGKYINSLTATKKEIDLRYAEVYNNANLLGTPKTDLAAKNTTFGTTHAALINSINNAIADGKTTATEKTDVDTKFATYQTDLSNLLKAFDTAAASIGQQMANSGSQAAKDYADGLKTDIDISINAVSKSVGDLNTYVDGAFEDSVISQAEAKAIEKYINLINGDKSDLDARYNDIYANGNLTGTPKTDLAAKKTAYNTAHTNLTTAINTAIADGKTTTAEKTDVDSKYTAYRTAVSNLSTSFENAVDAIAIKLADNAKTAANTYADGLKQATDVSIGNVSKSVTDLNTYVDGSFKDGVIQQAEAIAIGKYINTLNANKMDYDKSYGEVYNNASLPAGAVKSDLLAKKTAFDTAHTNLVNSINTAITDGKTTSAEKTDVDTKFTAYNTAISNLRVSIEAATNLISQTLVNSVVIADRNLLLDTGGVIVQGTNPPSTGYPNKDFAMSPTTLTSLRNKEIVIGVLFTGKITAWGATNRWVGLEVAVTYADASQAWLSMRLDVASSGFQLNKDYVREPFYVVNKVLDKDVTSVRAYSLTRDNTGTTKMEEFFVGVGNKYNGWSPAPEDATKALDDLKDYIDTDFHDDIISQAEADSIAKMLYDIDARKNDTEQNYQRTYNNGFLKTTSIKTALSTAKTNFDSAYTALRTSITNATADGKLLAAEMTDIDSKYTTFKTRISEMSTAYNNALDDIMKGRQDQAAADSKTYADTNFQRSFYQQPDPPTAPKIGDIWVETDVFPNVWWAFRGQGWVRSIVNDLSSMVGKIGSTQITDGAVLTPAIGANQVVASHIKAGAVTSSKLDVTALNMIDNFSLTGDITTNWRRWSSSGTVNTATLAEPPVGSGFYTGLKGLNLTSNGDQMYVSNMIPVSASQDYKVRLSYSKPSSVGTMYFGVFCYDKDGVNIPIETFNVASRTFTGSNTNQYFHWSTNGGTYHMEAYLAASYRPDNEMPQGYGVTNHMRLPAIAAYIQLRVLNYYNNGTTTSIYFINPSMQLADNGRLSFDNFQGGTGTLGGVNNGNGKLNVQDGSGNLKGTWDKDGIYLRGGGFKVERPDGAVWVENGMAKWNFAINPHEPPIRGGNVELYGSWFRTRVGTDRTGQTCNFYSYQHTGTKLNLELGYFAETLNPNGAIVVYERDGATIMGQFAINNTNQNQASTFTFPIGTPTFEVRAFYLAIFNWSNVYTYVRNIRMWVSD